MSAARSVMLLSGVVLAIVAILAGLARSVDIEWATRLSSELFWTILFAALVLAVILFIFRPPSRKTERRVNLAAPAAQNQMARPQQAGPSRQAALPVTRTVRDPKKSAGPQSGSHEKPSTGSGSSRDAPSGENKVADTASRSPGPVGLTMGKSATGDAEKPYRPEARAQNRPNGNNNGNNNGNSNGHPNGNGNGDHNPHGAPGDPQIRRASAAYRETPMHETAHAPPSLREPHAPDSYESVDAGAYQLKQEAGPDAPPSLRGQADVSDRFQSPYVAPRTPYDAESHRRCQRRREELENRLENLDQRANAAKVSLGLGRISHAGYRQYVKEVDRERTLIEGELMTLRGE